ncbi:serine hydrolase domain-containing protein [Legionella cardiaca]|uniref:Serine hydrolase n=1 Tax=Legionella cardiaca TaxID=1071983 RepID=A0ABY8ASV0_9GAMM|nr:serine hydrolase domain-containing protein [Legionella cardiaca]WED43286.1 serine hydrolase [Legionella cardiaca]
MLSIRPFLLFLTTLFSLLFGSASFASEPHEQVDSFINKEMKEQQIPGLGVLVIEDGKIIKNQGYGFSNLELTTPVTPDTVFQLASASKHFTAFAILTLVDSGKITSLDDPLDKYLGESIPSDWKQITIRQLLSHTSGIPGFPADFNNQQDYTEAQLLDFIAKQKLLFKPGEDWMYSNGGYVLLGIIIHKVSGKFYGDYLQEVAFKPLGMASTRINNVAEIIPNRAAGYEMIDNKLQNQSWVAPSLNTTADGSVLTTLNDMAKWNDALDKQKILSKAMYQAWWTPIKLKNGRNFPYSFGWIIGNVNDHRHIEHAGQWQGFRTQISRFPDDNFTVVVLMNSNHIDPVFIAQEVTRIYKPALAAPLHKPVKLDQALLARYAGTYKNSLLPTEIKIQATKNNHLLFNNMIFIPYTETSFFTPNSVMTLTFEVDQNQKVSALTQHIQGDVKLVYKRI